MRYSWVNALVVVFIAVELASGAFGLVSGNPDRAFLIQIHRFAGYGLLAVLGWKLAQAAYSMRRRRRVVSRPRVVSIALALSLAVTMALGLWWSIIGSFHMGPFSGVSWHIYVGVAVAPLAAWHAIDYARGIRIGYWADRRTALRLAAASIAGLAMWQVVELGTRVGGLAAAGRRFTGSYEFPVRHDGRFPVVYWLSDRTPGIDGDQWRLRVDGLVRRVSSLSIERFDDPADHVVVLDCTGGWYTTQTWSGIWLSDLLEPAEVHPGARSVKVTSVTGYYRRFPIEDAGSLLLATHVAGKTLTPGHGFPIRLVAPGRRGFEWVKWVDSVTVEDVPHWWQPPLPLQ